MLQFRESWRRCGDVLGAEKRRALLRSCLDRERIFTTPRFHAEREDPARQNLGHAVASSGA